MERSDESEETCGKPQAKEAHNVQRWRDGERLVERGNANEKSRREPQAKETAGPTFQNHELKSPNDGLWGLISAGSKH